MRKTTLVAAAILAAGLASSMAQNVYSLNVVGYVNLTLKPGYNLVTAQLVDTANPTAPINSILINAPALADGSTFVAWNPVAQDFVEAANWVGAPPDGPAWYNADYSGLVPDTAPRGTSFFIFNAGVSDATMTLVGEVPQDSKVVSIPNNNSFLADPAPVSQEILTQGFPVTDGSTLTIFDPLAQDYMEALNGVATPPDGPNWYNADYSAVVNFAPAVGQGFLYNTVGATTWTRTFSVQ